MNKFGDEGLNISKTIKPSSGTSFPQEAFYYYIKQIDPTVVNRDMVGGKEVDIHIPSLHVGIEYDGAYFHSGDSAKSKELIKNKVLQEHGLKLIRVKEDKSNFDAIRFEEVDGVSIFTFSTWGGYNNLGAVIIEVLALIFGGCSISVNPFEPSHELAILESYRQNLSEMSLMAQYPELAKQWHPTKNGKLKPCAIYPYSDYKAWWICKLGHEWQSTVSNRTMGNGCPYCSGHKTLSGFNDLETKFPELAKQWHPTKNGDLNPSDVTPHSMKKVWWMCDNGHEWQSTVDNRTRGNGCPYCAGKMVLVGFNDLESQNPELAKQWHPTKNGNLKPSDVTSASNKKAWWICELGHEWEATISHRTRGSGCPICAGKVVLSGFNDLESKNPKLAKQWHPTKNGDLKPSDVTPYSMKKVWWMCDHGHEWQASIGNRASGKGCPYCSGHKTLEGFNDLRTKYPNIANEWHPTKNGDLRPTTVSASSGRIVWWICKYGHAWKASVASRTQGCGCPICSGHRVLAGFNDLETKFPELAKQWHPTKNGDLKPSDVTHGSTKKVWWMCDNGHEWDAQVSERTRGNGCPICSGKRVLVGFNDLETKFPELAKQWHPTENGDLKPTDVTPYSGKKVWWECKHGHKWDARVSERTQGCGCPICSGKRVLVGFNDLETKFPELAKQWHPTKNGNLKPSDVTHGSTKKVWWVCGCGHEWEATIANRTNGRGCPECAKLNRKKTWKK